jgi:hypothetical protein
MHVEPRNAMNSQAWATIAGKVAVMGLGGTSQRELLQSSPQQRVYRSLGFWFQADHDRGIERETVSLPKLWTFISSRIF